MARFCWWRPDLAARGHIFFFFLICRCWRRLVWLVTSARPHRQRHTKEVFFFIKYGCPYDQMTQIRVGGKKPFSISGWWKKFILKNILPQTLIGSQIWWKKIHYLVVGSLSQGRPSMANVDNDNLKKKACQGMAAIDRSGRTWSFPHLNWLVRPYDHAAMGDRVFCCFFKKNLKRINLNHPFH